MRRTVQLLIVLVALWVLDSGTGAQPAAVPLSSDSAVGADPADGVMLLIVPDLSGSMAKPLATLREAEVGQLKRSLRLGDIYARIPFTAKARVAVLQRVSGAADIELIARVVDQEESAAGRTELSSGLSRARTLVEELGGNRRVILVLISDGIQSPADGLQAERKRLAEVAGWWRERPGAQRFLVGVPAKANATTLADLAESLAAHLITPEAFANDTIVERAIITSRVTPAQAQPPDPIPAPKDEPLSLLPAALAVSGLVLLWVYIRRRRGRKAVTEAPTVRLTAPSPPAQQLVVKVVSGGRPEQRVIDMTTLPGGVLTLGTAGTVFVPGIPGSPVAVEFSDGEISLSIAAGTGVRVNGEAADALPQPMRVGSACRLSAADGTTVMLGAKAVSTTITGPPLMALRRRRVH